jgi:glucose-6-phosphate isomerase
LQHLIDVIGERNWAINVISKSGTTTEPALAFRVLKAALEAKYGAEQAKSRIYATTDKARGALKQLADNQGYDTFVVPDDVGGRFSVLTAVGLLPIAVAGIDTDALLKGAQTARMHFKTADFPNSEVLRYVAARNILLRKGKCIEILANYEPRLHNIAEWWKQLFGESEGKDGKGIFTASVDFTSDLHSLGQFIQDGSRNLFETVLRINQPEASIFIPTTEDNLDGFNYLAGKSLDFVNEKALEGTRMAHIDGGVPNISIGIPDHSPESLGALFYFFELSCAVSGYVLGVNPFDQPGVEAYKKNMFALLGKS